MNKIKYINKRIILILMAIVMAIFLCSCSGASSSIESSQTSTEPSSSSAESQTSSADETLTESSASEAVDEVTKSSSQKSSTTQKSSSKAVSSSRTTSSSQKSPSKEQTQTSTTPTSSTEPSTSKGINVTLVVDFRNAGGKVDTYENLNLKDGASVYDALKAKYSKVTITNTFGSIYVSGINNICEFQHGSGSGWIYKVNREKSNQSCNKNTIKNGDKVRWIYTLDMGTTEANSNEE